MSLGGGVARLGGATHRSEGPTWSKRPRRLEGRGLCAVGAQRHQSRAHSVAVPAGASVVTVPPVGTAGVDRVAPQPIAAVAVVVAVVVAVEEERCPDEHAPMTELSAVVEARRPGEAASAHATHVRATHVTATHVGTAHGAAAEGRPGSTAAPVSTSAAAPVSTSPATSASARIGWDGETCNHEQRHSGPAQCE